MPPPFQRISQHLPGQGQQNGNRTTLKDTSSRISIEPLRLYLSSKSLLNFLLSLYIPPCLGDFKTRDTDLEFFKE